MRRAPLRWGSGLTASDVYLQADESGNLSVDIVGDPNDQIIVQDGLTYNGTVNSAISAITFADGSSIDLTQRPLTFTWLGASNNYNLSGNTWGTNIFDITQGNGSITFGKTAGVGPGVNTSLIMRREPAWRPLTRVTRRALSRWVRV